MTIEDKVIMGSDLCNSECIERNNIIHPETCLGQVRLTDSNGLSLYDWINNNSNNPVEYYSSLKDWLNDNYSSSSSDIPIATTTKIGGVKIDDEYLTINMEGLLGVDVEALPSYEEHNASFDILGSVKLGNDTIINEDFGNGTITIDDFYKFPLRSDTNNRTGIAIPKSMFNGTQADWNENDASSLSYILNKPQIANPNWDEENPNSLAYIQNKPVIPTLDGYATEQWVINQGYSTFDGDYNSLTNKPTIPTVNNATLTIKQGGVSKGTFTANAGTDVEINLDAGSGSDVNVVQTETDTGTKPLLLSTVQNSGDAGTADYSNSALFNARDNILTIIKEGEKGSSNKIDISGDGVLMSSRDDDESPYTEIENKIITSNGLIDAPVSNQSYLTYNNGNFSWDYLGVATSNTNGLIKIGYNQNGRNYPVQLSNDKAYVNVPWENTSYTAGNNIQINGTTISATDTTYTGGEGISISSDVVSQIAATNNTLGGIKLGYTKNDNKKPVQLDANNKAYVDTEQHLTIGGMITNGLSAHFYRVGTGSSAGSFTQNTWIPIIISTSSNIGKCSVEFEILGREDGKTSYGKYYVNHMTNTTNKLLCLSFYSEDTDHFDYNDIRAAKYAIDNNNVTIVVYKKVRDVSDSMFIVNILAENTTYYSTQHYFYTGSSSIGDANYLLTRTDLRIGTMNADTQSITAKLINDESASSVTMSTIGATNATYYTTT